MNDTTLLNSGQRTLIDRFGVVNTERFIYLVNTEPFDYTKFRHTLFEGMSHEDICREAKQAKIEADERKTPRTGTPYSLIGLRSFTSAM